MMRQCYCFPDEATALAAFGVTEWAEVSSWVAVYGTLYAPTGETTTDGEGNPVAVMVPLDGFHVDAVSATGETGHFPAGYRVYPNSPSMDVM
jgi:hypothetical protein